MINEVDRSVTNDCIRCILVEYAQEFVVSLDSFVATHIIVNIQEEYHVDQ